VVTIAARYGQAADGLSNALPFTVTKQDQSIIFATLPDRPASDPPFSVAATASSGLPVAFSASGQCTATGTLVTVTGQGSCTITASQAGDATFNAAPPINQTFAVRSMGVFLPGALVEHGIG
jgi:hypothetical protein